MTSRRNSPQTRAANERFLPTNTHQLTPYASPVSEKKCIEIDDSVFFSSLDDDKVSVTPSLALPVRSYMPRRVSGSGASRICLDGDVTPPLHPRPTIQIVSPSGLAMGLAGDQPQQPLDWKRKRSTEDRFFDNNGAISCSPPTLPTLPSRQTSLAIPMLPDLTVEADPCPLLKKRRTTLRRSLPFIPKLSLPNGDDSNA